MCPHTWCRTRWMHLPVWIKQHEADLIWSVLSLGCKCKQQEWPSSMSRASGETSPALSPDSAQCSISQRMATFPSLRQLSSLGMLSRMISSRRKPSFSSCCTWGLRPSTLAVYRVALTRRHGGHVWTYGLVGCCFKVFTLYTFVIVHDVFLDNHLFTWWCVKRR